MVAILDHNGHPLEKQALKQPQTAAIAPLHQEFASHPTRGLTPARLAQIMQNSERGDLMAQCDLFEDIEEKDGHVMAELGKRKRALLGLDWDIKPPRNASAAETAIAARVQDIILNIVNFEDVLLDMADAIGYGYSCLEFEWQRTDYWHPAQIHHRPPRWFKIPDGQSDVLHLRDNTVDGAPLWRGGWMVHIHKAKSGGLARAGLHRTLAWPFLFKNYSVRDLAEFLEIYGLPVRLGQYPRGASESEKMTLLRAVTNMGHAAAGIIPEGMLVEFKEAAKGHSDPYVAMISWCEKTQSKAILGGTLTSQADGASSTNALGNVHNEVRRDLLVADAQQIASTLSRDLVGLICHLNGWITDRLRCPRFVFDTVEADDLGLLSEALPKLVAIGVPIPVSYVQDKLRIPVPEANEPVLAAALPAVVTELAATGQAEPHDPTPLDAQSEQLALETAPALSGMIASVLKKVQTADSLAALQADLVGSYGDLDSDQLTQVMTLAFATAELSGRYDVNEGD